MKTTTLAITLCGCLVGTAINAEEGEKGKKGPGDRGEIFQTLDTDKDHAISKEEAGERWDRIGKMDKNNDGKVTVAELGAGRPGEGPGGQKGPKGNPGEMFARADKNKDEKITEDEVPAEFWEKLSKLDKDNDGAVSKRELAAGRPGEGPGGQKGRGGNPGELFAKADTNKDEKISEDEVPAALWEKLSKFDKDKDGAVTTQELAAGRMAMGGKGGPGGKGKGGEFFDRADKDNDGKLSKTELPAEAWERIGKFDKDGDDAVSKEELAMGFRGAMEGRGGKGGKGRPDGGPAAIFSSMDKNNDEKLSEDEVPAEMWAKISKADEDADGRVSKAELEKVFQARQEMMGDGPKVEEKKRPELENESA